MLGILFLSCLAFPVIFLLNLPQIVASMSIGLASLISSLNVLFLPKAIQIYEGQDVDEKLSIGKKPSNAKGEAQIHPMNGTSGAAVVLAKAL